jgi:arylsulfatase A-like enzyme
MRTAALAILLAGLFVTPAPVACAAAAQAPNIVYICVDELGYYELSCMGHPHMRTPNIDRLAAGGVRFTDMRAGGTVCAPTRCCLMTGKHMGHTSVRANDGGTPLRAGEETIASVLRKAGYATGGFGKWGCGGRGSTGVPEKHGFDVFFGYYDQVHAHTYYPAYLVRNSEEVPLEGNHGGRSGKTYSHYVIIDEAKKWMRANKDRPFFCYLPVTPPHGLFDIPEDDPAWALYKNRNWPSEDAKRYAAMVNMVDRNVGEIVDLLKELGVLDNTYVFVSGDNGGALYFKDKKHPNGFHGPNVDPKTGSVFRGEKGTLYEGGLRVFFAAYAPGRIPPGGVSEHLSYFPDVLPTIAELAGAPCPEDVDGISFAPELLGAKAAGREQKNHEFQYWENGGRAAVRMGDWKAIGPIGKDGWELYDLSKDASESRNVAAEHPDVLERIRGIVGKAHEPARPGTYADRSLHERDRQQKSPQANTRLRRDTSSSSSSSYSQNFANFEDEGRGRVR